MLLNEKRGICGPKTVSFPEKTSNLEFKMKFMDHINNGSINYGPIIYGSKSYLCNYSKLIAGQDVECQHSSTEDLKLRI